jgi:hypothetical protein
MSRPTALTFDEVGSWSEVTLDIIRDYAKACSTVLAAQQRPPFYHVYIDAFTGAGIHVSKTSGDVIRVLRPRRARPAAGPRRRQAPTPRRHAGAE